MDRAATCFLYFRPPPVTTSIPAQPSVAQLSSASHDTHSPTAWPRRSIQARNPPFGVQRLHTLDTGAEVDARAVFGHVLTGRDAHDLHAAGVGEVVQEFGRDEEVLAAS